MERAALASRGRSSFAGFWYRFIQVQFVIMGNLFCSNCAIHRRFDLKGSSHGRMTDKPIDQIDETTTLKDLDLNFIFRLEGSWFKDFCRQVDKDCEFLEQERIMDYSLLVGIRFKDRWKDMFTIHDCFEYLQLQNYKRCI